MQFSSSNRKQKYEYKMKGEILETVSQHPYLGVELSDNLKFNDHIDNSLKQWYVISRSGSSRRFTHSVKTQVILRYPNVFWWIYNLQYLKNYSKICAEIFSID